MTAKPIRDGFTHLAPEDVDAIAYRVVELLAEAKELPPAGLVDAETLARELGVTRSYVYSHRKDLGGIRLGDGPKARLRFDVATAKGAHTTAETDVAAPPRPRRRRTTRQAVTPVLQSRPRRVPSTEREAA